MAQHKQGEREAAIDAFRAAASLAMSALTATLASPGAAEEAHGATSALLHNPLSAVPEEAHEAHGARSAQLHNALSAVPGAADEAHGARSAQSRHALSAHPGPTTTTGSANTLDADTVPYPHVKTLADDAATPDEHVTSQNPAASQSEARLAGLEPSAPSPRQGTITDAGGVGGADVDDSRLRRLFVQAKLAEGSALRELGRIQEALAAVEAAEKVDPSLERRYGNELRTELETLH